MKKLLITSIAALGLFGVPAFAADMAVKAPPPAAPPLPVFSWTGFYIGADIGGAWASQDATNTLCCGQEGASSSLHSNSALGGFYAGYNWMVTPQFLLG